MPIILPEPYEPDARLDAITDVAIMIKDAMTSDESVSIYDLAEEIVDFLRPAFATRLPLAAMREWQERHRSEEIERVFKALSSAREAASLAASKPRIRVRAATQHTA
jgi:hypothetical protein